MKRTIDFRYRVLRNGGNFCLLQPAANSAPTVRMDDSGEIKTSFSGAFLIPDADVNWMSDEIRPELIVDGVTSPLGVFLPATVSETNNGISKSIQIEAYDRGWLARDCRSQTMPFFAAGSNYLSTIGSVLAAAGIIQISETPTSVTLSEDRADWEIGTSALEIANKLLDEINYQHVWFDAEGTCILKPIASATAENISHTLNEKNVESMILPGYRRSTDFYSAPNVFVCICSNADKAGPMVASAENTNPLSPLSIARRGRRIVKVITLDNIGSQEELTLYAQRCVTESMLTGEKISVQTGLLPGFGVGDVVSLQYDDIFSICRDRAWTMQLTVGGKMTHTLERVVMNLG